MPTVFWDGPYAFLFFSSDRDEPPHVHVRRDRQVAKFWLEPVVLATNRSFARHELRQIERLIDEYQAGLMGAWHEYFGIGK